MWLIKTYAKYNNLFYVLIFLLSEFIETVLVTFVDIVFVAFIVTISVTFIILLHAVTELSTILLKHLLFSQINLLGFQLKPFFACATTFYNHIDTYHYSINVFA